MQHELGKTVIPYFNRFIKNIPNLEALASFENRKLFKLWEGLGYYSRARNLKKTAQVIIKDYTIDINGREMALKNIKLKLTEKEVNTIIYLSKFNKPISINELQTKVWDYHSDIETHTVETHIYRLRKKIFKSFLDDNFIISKNNGYQIK